MTIDAFDKNIARNINMLPDSIVNNNNLELPIGINIFWTNFSLISNVPNQEISYLRDRKINLITEDTYFTLNGDPKKILGNFKSDFKDLKRQNKNFKFIKPGASNVSFNSTTDLIFNYGMLESLYSYKASKLVELYRWENNLNTVIDKINKVPVNDRRKNILRFELPYRVEDFNTLERMTNFDSAKLARLEKGPKHLNLIDLFKFLNPEKHEESILSKIDKDRLKDTYLLLSIERENVVINLEVLLRSVKDFTDSISGYVFEEKFTGISKKDVMVRKTLFMSVLLLLITSIRKRNSKKDLGIAKFSDSSLNDIVKESINLGIMSTEEENITEEKEDEAIELSDVVIEEDITDDRESETIDSVLDKMRENGNIGKGTYDRFKDTLEKQEKANSPYPGEKRKLKDLLVYNKEETELTEEELSIPDSPTVPDKRALKDTVNVMRKKYVKETYRKDVVSSVYKLQDSRILVSNHEVNVVEDSLGGYEEHTIVLTPLKGRPSTLRFRLPILKPDGSYTMSGNNYLLRPQKADLPIRKIKSDEVSLSSYYGKLFVNKSRYANKNVGIWYLKKLRAKSLQEDDFNILISNEIEYEVEVPLMYSQVGRVIKSVKSKDYDLEFKFKSRDRFGEDLKKLDKKDRIFIGKNKNKNVFMTFDNVVYIEDKKIGSIEEMFDIDPKKKPLEYSEIKIFRKTLPLVVMLSYYLGLEKLMKSQKVNYKLHNDKKDAVGNGLKIQFKDKVLELPEDLSKENELLLAGLLDIEKQLKKINFKDLNNPNLFSSVFAIYNLPSLYTTEIKILKNLFLDPMTKDVLESLNEPTEFIKLLLRANYLLRDNNYLNPNNGKEVYYKGNERIAGILYSNLVNSIREFENKNVYSKSRINLDPYKTWKDLGDDSTSMLIDDLNPIAYLKQMDEFTVTGAGGRSKTTMVKSTRAYHPTNVGIVSEASKDSSDVAISASMSASPKFKNTRGIREDFDFDRDGISSVLSNSAMLSPAGTKDDMKRLNFVSIQNGHVIPITGATAPIIRTGYEPIFAYKSPDIYVYNAQQDGIVDKVTDKVIRVLYKNGEKEDIELGVWSSKEEAGMSYKHNNVTFLRSGDKFKRGDVLRYDEAFYVRDILDRNKVIMKTSKTLSTALIEIPETHEDSSVITKKASKKLSTLLYKVKSHKISDKDKLLEFKDVNTEVKPSDILFLATDKNTFINNKIDEETRDILQGLKRGSPKAEVKGRIEKIEINYNKSDEALDKSIEDLIKKHKKNFKEVNNQYSINGKPLDVGEIEIKFFIMFEEEVGVGDKTIFGNQLKTTKGEVINYDILDEDGNEVEAIFSFTSIAARIVNSPIIIGLYSKLIETIKNRAIKKYFNKK